MAKAPSSVKDYLRIVMKDILPPSAIQQYDLNRIGLHFVPKDHLIRIKDELPDSKSIYAHEKCTPDRFLLQNLNKEGVFNPIYFRYYNDSSMISALGKIIVNSALQIYPTPLNTYGMIRESVSSHSIGIATIDLNHLVNSETKEDVKSTRLDILLHQLGLPHEINSFMDFQNLLQNEGFVKSLTPRAIVQLGLSSIFIPNAIGETDPNSRNVILLRCGEEEPFDTVVRIDAEANTYLNDADRTRSGNKAVPKGIFTANENLDEFLMHISSKDPRIDWDLFMGFSLLTQHFTSRSHVDSAITKSYFLNPGKTSDPYADFHPSPYKSHYNDEEFYKFAEATISRAERFNDKVLDACGGLVLHADLPFAESNSAYPDIVLTDTQFAKIEQAEHTETPPQEQ